VNNGSSNSKITFWFTRCVFARAQTTRGEIEKKLNSILKTKFVYFFFFVKDELTAETVKNGFTFKPVDGLLEVKISFFFRQ